MSGRTNRLSGILMPVLIIAFLFMLLGCGSGGMTDATSSSGGTTGGTGGTGGTGTGGSSGTTQTAAKIVLAPSPYSVKSGGGDAGASTITATVIDSYNVRVANIKVNFKTDVGVLSAPYSTTGANGEDAEVTFSSGSLNSNAKITAWTDSGVSEWTTVVAYGTTLAKSTDLTTPTNDGTAAAKAKLTITANDARGNPIRYVPIMFSTSTTGGAVAVYDYKTGAALTDNTKETDVYGQVNVTVEGKTAGAVTVKATVKIASDSAAPETSVTQDYTVTAPADIIAIEDPAAETVNMSTTGNIPLAVKSTASATLRFTASRGYFDGDPTKISTVKAVAANYANATFYCTTAGFATIEVSDPNNPSSKDVLNVYVSAPLGAAPKIKLESSAYNVAPSTGGVVNTVKLTATVTTANDYPVGSVPVAFSITAHTTGGTEKISPLIVFTDGSNGTATTTFTSGEFGSIGQGVTVQASLVSNAAVKATTSIFITGTPGSVAIGRGTVLSSATSAEYKLPVIVIVTDSGGHAVPDWPVSLEIWPTSYQTGTWVYTLNATGQKIWYNKTTGTFINEDTDEDTILDPLEDANGDGELTPHNSFAGALPTSVKTDGDGKAVFDLIYPKDSAFWIEDRIKAKIMVGGTETTTSVRFWLSATKQDIEDGVLHPSPFGICPVGQLWNSATQTCQ